MKNKNGWKIVGIICFVISIIFLFVGFDKLFFMKNGTIDISKAILYFLLATFFILLSIGSGIFYYFSKINKDLQQIKFSNTSTNNSSDKWTCTNCGTLNATTNKFCENCGTKFEKGEM